MTTIPHTAARKKIRIGFVVSDKMDKTRVIAVHWTEQHPVYHRHVRRLTKFKAHDERNETRTGDRVRIIETRPRSKEKRWRILEVLERAEQVDVRPEEVGQTIIEELGQRSTGSATPAPATVAAAPPAVVAPVEETAPAEPVKKPRTRKKVEPAAEQAAEAAPAEEQAEPKPARKPRAKKSTEESKS